MCAKVPICLPRDVPLRVEALHVLVLRLDFYQLAEVKKSFACSAGLEMVIDHVSDLSSSQESIVHLRLLLFHVESPLEIISNFLRALAIFF